METDLTPSPRKRAAARANGALGSGHKTPDGLANSSRNALRHGLYSESTWVLSTETQPMFDQLLSDFIQRFQPIDGVELRLVHKMAVAQWRQERIWDLEAATLDQEIANQWDAVEPGVWGHDLRSALAFEAKAAEVRAYARVESHYCHRFESARRALMKLQENRPPQSDFRNEAKPEIDQQTPSQTHDQIPENVPDSPDNTPPATLIRTNYALRQRRTTPIPAWLVPDTRAEPRPLTRATLVGSIEARES